MDARRGTARLTRSAGQLAALAVLCFSVGACAGQPPAGDEGGFGLPILPSNDPPRGPAGVVTGTLRVESNGCFTLDLDEGDQPWVVWPSGTTQEGDRVILPGGDEVGDGDRLRGDGALADADDLPEWSVSDSYFHAFGTFCGADERGVVLLDRVHRDR